MRIRNETDFEKLVLARELVARGLRTYMISSLTDMSPHEVRKLHHCMGHSLTDKVGHASSTASICRSLIAQIRFSVHAVILRKGCLESFEGRIDPVALIRHFDTAQALCPIPELNLSQAWTLLTELRLGVVALRECRRCGSLYLQVFDQPRLSLSCPFCAMRKRIARRQEKASRFALGEHGNDR